MATVSFRSASDRDIPFISETYELNIEKLHGAVRSRELWQQKLVDGQTKYYIIHATEPVAWFSLELEDGILWLAMLQVHPNFQRQGFGKMTLGFVEAEAKAKGISQVGIHATEDNLPASALYQSCGYAVTEYGPCTTADGVDRMGYTFMKEI